MTQLEALRASRLVDSVTSHCTVADECNVIQIVEKERNVLVLRRPLSPSLTALAGCDLRQLHNQLTIRCTHRCEKPPTISRRPRGNARCHWQQFVRVPQCRSAIRHQGALHTSCPKLNKLSSHISQRDDANRDRSRADHCA